MAAPSTGAVVLIRFPFSDLTASKLRPAVALAAADRGDMILCQITSNPYADSRAIELREDSFRAGNLQRVSYARPGKLFTAHESIIAREVGVLTEEARRRVIEAVVDLIRSGG